MPALCWLCLEQAKDQALVRDPQDRADKAVGQSVMGACLAEGRPLRVGRGIGQGFDHHKGLRPGVVIGQV